MLPPPSSQAFNAREVSALRAEVQALAAQNAWLAERLQTTEDGARASAASEAAATATARAEVAEAKRALAQAARREAAAKSESERLAAQRDALERRGGAAGAQLGAAVDGAVVLDAEDSADARVSACWLARCWVCAAERCGGGWAESAADALKARWAAPPLLPSGQLSEQALREALMANAMSTAGAELDGSLRGRRTATPAGVVEELTAVAAVHAAMADAAGCGVEAAMAGGADARHHAAGDGLALELSTDQRQDTRAAAAYLVHWWRRADSEELVGLVEDASAEAARWCDFLSRPIAGLTPSDAVEVRRGLRALRRIRLRERLRSRPRCASAVEVAD